VAASTHEGAAPAGFLLVAVVFVGVGVGGVGGGCWGEGVDSSSAALLLKPRAVLLRPRPLNQVSSHHSQATPLITTHAPPTGEEDHIGGAHQSLRKEWPRLLTIIAPRQPGRAHALAADLKERLQLNAVLWSSGGLEETTGSSGSGGATGSSSRRADGGRSGSPVRGGAAVKPPKLEGVDVVVMDVPADLPLMYWCVTLIVIMLLRLCG